MIRLTESSGEYVWINPEQIESVGHSDYYNGTVVVMSGMESDDTPLTVKESPEEVARKVLEYRLELERYKAAVRVGIEQDNLSGRQMAEGAMDILGELAGLEEQKDE